MFIDGELDTNFMHQNIRQRRNILSEMLIVREALTTSRNPEISTTL